MQRQFNLQPSKYLAAALLLSHGAALVVLGVLAMPLWLKALLILLVLASLFYHMRQEAWLSAGSSNRQLVLEGDQLLLIGCNGDQMHVRILADSLVTPFLTVLVVLPHGANFTRSIVIMPDSLDAESFRRLRVWLRWGNAGLGSVP